MWIWNFEVLRLLYVDLCVEKFMEKSCLNVKVNNYYVLLCGNSKYCLDGFIFYNRVNGLVIIYFIFLCVIFCNNVYFEFCNEFIKVSFDFVNLFVYYWFVIRRE